MSISSTPQSVDKTILITGCSSGIGLDTALRFRDMGWQVLATCRQKKDCAELIKQGLISFPLDYEDEASIEAGFSEAMKQSGGRIDVLFNNGAYAIPAAVEDVPTAAMRQILRLIFLAGII